MWEHFSHTLVTRLQRVGWIYFANNFYVESASDFSVPTPRQPLQLVQITPENCARVQDFRPAYRRAEYAMKLEKGEVGYFAVMAGTMVGSIWATINRTSAPCVARGYMWLRPGEALIHDVVAGEGFRGMGVGPFMVGSFLVALLDQYMVSKVIIDVSVRNRPSLRMMAKAGLYAKDATLSVSAFGSLKWKFTMCPRN